MPPSAIITITSLRQRNTLGSKPATATNTFDVPLTGADPADDMRKALSTWATSTTGFLSWKARYNVTFVGESEGDVQEKTSSKQYNLLVGDRQAMIDDIVATYTNNIKMCPVVVVRKTAVVVLRDQAPVEAVLPAVPASSEEIVRRKPSYLPGTAMVVSRDQPSTKLATSGVINLLLDPTLPKGPVTVSDVWSEASASEPPPTRVLTVSRKTKIIDSSSPRELKETISVPSNLDCIVTTHVTPKKDSACIKYLEMSNLPQDAKDAILKIVPAEGYPHICVWLRTSIGTFLNPDGEDIDEQLTSIKNSIAKLYRAALTSKILFFMTINCYTQDAKNMIAKKITQLVFAPLIELFPGVFVDNIALFAELNIENAKRLLMTVTAEFTPEQKSAIQKLPDENIAPFNPRTLLGQSETSYEFVHSIASL